MRLRIPSAGTPISGLDLARAWFPAGGVAAFEEALARWVGLPWCRCANSGTTAIYLALQALRRLRPGREEVLLPAYTAPSLVLPIRKAGLRPTLCDVDLETFNGDFTDAPVSERTLAVMAIPMFGLPCDPGEARKAADRAGAFLIEDAASAMGSGIGDSRCGAFGDVGIFSFNRGKNLSTVSGGALLGASQEIRLAVEDALRRIPPASPAFRMGVRIRAKALSMAVRPFWYTLLRAVISRYKYVTLHEDFDSFAYTGFQARLGRSLLRRSETFLTRRLKNGILWGNLLGGVAGIALPRPVNGALTVYNQFPILLEDRRARDAAHAAVLSTGVEATTLYPDPIHRLYPDLGIPRDPDPYPRASSMARRLLLLPTHPMVPEARIAEAASAVLRAVTREA